LRFTLTSLGRLPEKSASECPVCPKRAACDEHAMLLHLDGTKPQALRAGEPWGYTRISSAASPAGRARSGKTGRTLVAFFDAAVMASPRTPRPVGSSR